MFPAEWEDTLWRFPDEVLAVRMERFLEDLPPSPKDDAGFAAPHTEEEDKDEFDDSSKTVASETLTATQFALEPAVTSAETYSCEETMMGGNFHDASDSNDMPLFEYLKVVPVDFAVWHFLRGIERESTVVHDQWPSHIPAEHYFFANDNLGLVDFGGRKSGTLYPGKGPYGLLVNYSCSNSRNKLSLLYKDCMFLKVWKLRLSCTTVPDGQEDDWTCEETRDATVYLYNKMALYIFGGELYLQDRNGCLTLDETADYGEGKTFVNLGPAIRSTKRKQPNDPTTKISKKRHVIVKKGNFDP